MPDQTLTYDLGKEFSELPFGRYREDGPNSAERFRDDILVKLLEEHRQINIILDNALTLGSSFLEESFGGLVRKALIDKNEFFDRIHFTSDVLPELVFMIRRYVQEAQPSRA